MQWDPPKDEDLGLTINLLRSTIQKYFIVKDVRYDAEAFAFFIQLDPRTLEENFDEFRRAALDLGFVPMLLKEKPGYIIYITRKPEKQYRSIYVNVAFLIATIITTIIAGMSFVASYEDIGFWSGQSVALGALYFAAPLMLILGVHEMGHYIMARRHKVAASLPFFIPAPPILGTFGAFISLREPIHSKRALMDIGFAGPIVGFVAAVFITILGLKLSAWDPHPVGDDASAYWILGTPLIYDLLTYLAPTPANVLIHPTAFAGWVGFLVTFLNLLPAGQLDGGHIVRALFGEHSKYVGYATVGMMLFFSWWFNYPGWIVFILFILFVLQHPPPLNDISPLPPGRWFVGMSAFVLLMVCFVPAPFMPSELEPEIEVYFVDPSLNIPLDGEMNATLIIVNTGNTRLTSLVRLQSTFGSWNITFEKKLKFQANSDWGQLNIRKDRSTNFTTTLNLTIAPLPGVELGQRNDLVMEFKYKDGEGRTKRLFAHVRVTAGWLEVDEETLPANAYVEIDGIASYDLAFDNLVYDNNDNATVFILDLDVPEGLIYTLTHSPVSNLTAETIGEIDPLERIGLRNNDSAALRLWFHAPKGTMEATDLPVIFNISLVDDPFVIVSIIFPLDIRNATYSVDIDGDTPVRFDKDEVKHVAFTLDSESNIDVTVDLTYDVDLTNWTILDSRDSLTVPAFTQQTFTLQMSADGEVGTISDLEIEITFGPSSKKKSVTIQLIIIDSG
jgi:membrane-associated protease RseP (regulator of RpoE activity)